MAIYMWVEGVRGDVTTSGYGGWIRCLSFDWGFAHPGRTIRELGREPTGHSARINEVTISKDVDIATADLARRSLNHDGYGDVTFEFVRTSGATPQCWQTITLMNTWPTSCTMSGAPESETMREVWTLSFTDLDFRFVPYDEGGTPEEPHTFHCSVPVGETR